MTSALGFISRRIRTLEFAVDTLATEKEDLRRKLAQEQYRANELDYKLKQANAKLETLLLTRDEGGRQEIAKQYVVQINDVFAQGYATQKRRDDHLRTILSRAFVHVMRGAP